MTIIVTLFRSYLAVIPKDNLISFFLYSGNIVQEIIIIKIYKTTKKNTRTLVYYTTSLIPLRDDRQENL